MKSMTLSSLLLFFFVFAGLSREAASQSCLKVTKRGAVKISGLNKKGSCGKRGVLLSEIVNNSGVSVTGPQGATGEQGPSGAQGPAGPGLESPLSFSAATFRPRNSSIDWTTTDSGSCIYQSAGAFGAILHLAISLPNGASIDSVKYYFFDSTADADTELYLSAYNISGGLELSNEWELSSSGSSGKGVAENTAIDHVVDNEMYTYVLNWRGSHTYTNQLQLCGVQIYFTTE